jgi:hypothetical protein
MSDNDDLRKEIIKNNSSVNKSELLQIATADDSTELVADLMSKDIPTQLKAFMLATAKSELVRVIQLTDALNKLEDTYIERALSDKDGMDMKSLSNTMDVIMRSLNRSMDLIDKVTTDNNLKLIIDQSTNIYNDNKSTIINNNLLLDQSGREKLRTLASKLLVAVKKEQKEEVVVDSNLEEVGDTNDRSESEESGSES